MLWIQIFFSWKAKGYKTLCKLWKIKRISSYELEGLAQETFDWTHLAALAAFQLRHRDHDQKVRWHWGYFKQVSSRTITRINTNSNSMALSYICNSPTISVVFPITNVTECTEQAHALWIVSGKYYYLFSTNIYWENCFIPFIEMKKLNLTRFKLIIQNHIGGNRIGLQTHLTINFFLFFFFFFAYWCPETLLHKFVKPVLIIRLLYAFI